MRRSRGSRGRNSVRGTWRARRSDLTTTSPRTSHGSSEAAGRRAYAAASAAFERAAALTRDDHRASERLLLSGGAAAAAGAPDRALTLVRAASRKAVSPATRRRAEHLAGRTLIWSGRASEATPLLVAEAEAVTVDSPEFAATILADAACGETTINSYVRAERLARRAVDLLGADGWRPVRPARGARDVRLGPRAPRPDAGGAPGARGGGAVG